MRDGGRSLVLGITSVQSSLPICKQNPLREQRLWGLWKEQIYIYNIYKGGLETAGPSTHNLEHPLEVNGDVDWDRR